MVKFSLFFPRFKVCFSAFVLVAALFLSGCDTEAFRRGKETGFKEGRSQGLEEGYSSGHVAGVNQGFARGMQDGRVAGHKVGLEEGYLAGEKVGHKNGYIEGQKAFMGEHWLPSVALGICGGLVLILAVGTIVLCRKPAAWLGTFAVLIAAGLRDRLLAGRALRRFKRKLKKQENELAAILKAKTNFICASKLRHSSLNLSEEVIHTKVQQFISESLIIPALEKVMSQSVNAFDETISYLKQSEEITPQKKVILLAELTKTIEPADETTSPPPLVNTYRVETAA